MKIKKFCTKINCTLHAHIRKMEKVNSLHQIRREMIQLKDQKKNYQLTYISYLVTFLPRATKRHFFSLWDRDYRSMKGHSLEVQNHCSLKSYTVEMKKILVFTNSAKISKLIIQFCNAHCNYFTRITKLGVKWYEGDSNSRTFLASVLIEFQFSALKIIIAPSEFRTRVQFKNYD